MNHHTQRIALACCTTLLAGLQPLPAQEAGGMDQIQKLKDKAEALEKELDALKNKYSKQLADLRSEMNVLVVAHGNSLRALIKYLEVIHEDEISNVEIGTGELCCYDLDDVGKVINKEIRGANSDKGKV